MMGKSFLFAVIASVCLAQIPPYDTYWYTQTVDHFNFETTPQTFQQRYLVNSDSYKPGGPMFFYTGNEGDITEFYDNTGFMFDIAPDFGALIVFAEHRYYGESLPFGMNSWNRDRIGLLNVEQALADYAELIPVVKRMFFMPPTAPVIAFGGSYGGMLSAWFRYKYPHVVDGALAASAPIKMFSAETQQNVFFDIITDDFNKINAQCPVLVRQAFAEVIALGNLGQKGYSQLTQQFSLCSPISTPAQLEHLILWVVNAFTSISMADYPYPTGFLGNLPAWPVRVACDIMMSSVVNSTILTGLSQAAGLYYNGTNGTLKCFNITDEFVECADQTGCGLGPGGWSWDYQACTEMIFYPSTNNVTDMFPPRTWNLDTLTAYCAKRWGVVPRQNWIATEFGGANIGAATNIIFSNGMLDPWHGGGFLKTIAPTLPSILIAQGAHHLDLRSSNPADPKSVIAARLQEIKYIQQWLDEKQKQDHSLSS